MLQSLVLNYVLGPTLTKLTNPVHPETLQNSHRSLSCNLLIQHSQEMYYSRVTTITNTKVGMTEKTSDHLSYLLNKFNDHETHDYEVFCRSKFPKAQMTVVLKKALVNHAMGTR